MIGALETSLLLHVAPDLINDAETVARLGASPEKGRRAFDYILDQVEVRWLRQPESHKSFSITTYYPNVSS